MKARVIYSILRILGSLPSGWHYAWSWMISYLLQYVIRYRRDVVWQNLQGSFPEKSERELRKIERAFYHYLSDLFVEIIMLAAFSEKRLRRHVQIANPEIMDEIHEENKTIFYLLGHYGNWEWLTGCQVFFEQTNFNVIYKKQHGVWNEVINRMRTKFGAKLIDMDVAPMEVLSRRHEQSNETYIFVNDQHTGNEKAVLFVDFLNRPTATITGMERLAQMRSAAVVYVDVRRLKRGKYEVTLKEMTRDASQLPRFDLATDFMHRLEHSIRSQPEIWLWSHRRWKIDPEWVRRYFPNKEIVMR